MKKLTLSILGAVTAIALISVIAFDDAYAHGRKDFDVTMVNGEHRSFQIVIGHTNEPTFGNEPGTWDGIHGLDLTIRDTETKLPISGADLTADKFYFKDLKKFEKANSPSDADNVELDIPVSSIFGQPGKYIVRQVLTEGIYGYHVYGTVTYFDGTDVNVDLTAFCNLDGETSKFNSDGYVGQFGCVGDIKDLKFPNP
jgi:hypothetical protein